MAIETRAVANVPPVTRVWPSLVSLSIVAAAAIGPIGVDVVVDQRTAEQTTKLLDRSLRSVQLADDLRYQARRLAQAGLDRELIVRISSRIGADAQEQAVLLPLEQQSEWNRLRDLLDALEVGHDPATKTVLIDSIEKSLDGLVTSYKIQASENAAIIRRLHARLLTVDIVSGILTLALIAIVAAALVRSLRRQRRLLKLYIESVEERERELEAFAARVAHDLRGPLSPIKGYAAMLGTHEMDVREIGQRIGRSVDKMVLIVDDLLALSVAGRPSAGVAAVDVVVNDVLDDLSDSIREVNADFTLHVESGAVACAPSVLYQILHNLIQNAIKYRSPDRKLEVDIRARLSVGQVVISVGDNGVGMDDDAASHAFEPFFRAKTATASGHGLGLAIVKRTVDALGGTCELSSAENRGTEIRLSLPASSTRAGDTQSAVA